MVAITSSAPDDMHARAFSKDMRVQWFIENTCIISLREGIHQCSWNIARATPQTDTRDILSHDCFVSFRRQTAR